MKLHLREALFKEQDRTGGGGKEGPIMEESEKDRKAFSISGDRLMSHEGGREAVMPTEGLRSRSFLKNPQGGIYKWWRKSSK